MGGPITPQFEEARKATQFGGENANPRYSENNGNKPHSIQRIMRDLAGREIDLENKDALRELSTGKRSIAYAIALKNLSKAMQGDARHTEICLDRIDGKVEQTISMKGMKEMLEAPDDVLDDLIISAAEEIKTKT